MTSRAIPIPINTGRPCMMRFTASVLAASRSTPSRVTRSLGTTDGRQSTCVASTPWAWRLSVKERRPTLTTFRGVPKNDWMVFSVTGLPPSRILGFRFQVSHLKFRVPDLCLTSYEP